jgi:hypothetical protein
LRLETSLTKVRGGCWKSISAWLLGAVRDAFIAAIERNPPAPRLVEALKRHRRVLG